KPPGRLRRLHVDTGVRRDDAAPQQEIVEAAHRGQPPRDAARPEAAAMTLRGEAPYMVRIGRSESRDPFALEELEQCDQVAPVRRERVRRQSPFRAELGQERV